MERKQESLSSNFTQSVFDDVAKQDSNIDEITLEVKPKPIVQDDESFTSLAERIVDEVIANQSPKSLAKQVLEQVGISHENPVAEPKVFNGHLRHVGRRARKISRKQNQSRECYCTEKHRKNCYKELTHTAHEPLRNIKTQNIRGLLQIDLETKIHILREWFSQ